MHDLDQTRLEADTEAFFEAEASQDEEFFEVANLDEVEESELATQLLGVSTEDELDEFIGRFVKKAGSFMRTPAGRMLTGYLKKAARRALPVLGGAVGTYFGGPAGTALGASLAGKAGQMFGLEVEGLSGEDQALEVAKSVVRLANAAAQRLAANPLVQTNPAAAARKAIIDAASIHAPGLFGRRRQGGVAGAAGRQSGRWIRSGRRIVLYGV